MGALSDMERALAGEARLALRVFDAGALVESYPPKLKNRNKRAVYEIACPEGAKHEGTLRVSRFRAMALPEKVPALGRSIDFEAREDVFDYAPLAAESQEQEWHVNFADIRLFCAYGGPLLAQDELQVAEHPALGSLREALLAAKDPLLPPLTRDGDAPTPILIQGVERRCELDTSPCSERPMGLYGNRFSQANVTTVREATRALEPPTITNLLAMEAPPGGRGAYSRSEIEDILVTAYTGFLGARLCSEESSGASVRVTVHTGHWGTGAYGGNRELMSLLQLAAARLARIDRLVYHTFDAAGSDAYREGFEFFEGIFDGKKRGAGERVEEILERIENLGFTWGVSDGN